MSPFDVSWGPENICVECERPISLAHAWKVVFEVLTYRDAVLASSIFPIAVDALVGFLVRVREVVLAGMIVGSEGGEDVDATDAPVLDLMYVPHVAHLALIGRSEVSEVVLWKRNREAVFDWEVARWCGCADDAVESGKGKSRKTEKLRFFSF